MQSAIIFSDQTCEFSTDGRRADRVSPAAEMVNNPVSIVLQPNGALDAKNSADFWQVLAEALDLAVESVVVDLLWVEKIDSVGVSTLVAGVEKATGLGKMLSFQSMNHQTRLAMETEWDRQRQQRLGNWSDRCESGLEQFLREGRKF